MRRIIPLAALAVSTAVGAGACKKSSSKSSPSWHTEPARSTAALWKLAPQGAIASVVVADGTGKALAAAVKETARVLGQQPLGKMLLAKLRSQVPPGLGIDPTDPKTWSKAGIDLSKGTAFFLLPDDKLVGILPVGDRAAFRRVTHADKKTVDGKEYDHIPGAYCAPVKGRYACADTTDLLAKIGSGKGRSVSAFAATLPKKMRGDVEMIMDLRAFNANNMTRALAPVLTNVTYLAITARLGHGRLSMRGWVKGKRGGRIGSMFADVPPKGGASKLIAGADSVLSVRVPRKLLAMLTAGARPLPGLDIKKDLVANLSGEFVAAASGPGLTSSEAAVGLSKSAPVKSRLRAMCRLLAAGMPPLGAKMNGGRCIGKVTVPKAEPAQKLWKLLEGMELALEVKKGALTLRAGQPRPPTGKPGDLAGGPTSQDLLTGDWQAVMWAHSLDPLAGLPAGDAKRIDALVKSMAPPQVAGALRLARWLAAHVYDAGVGLSLRKDGIHAELALDTFAADPKAVYKQYEAAAEKGVSGDFAGYRSALAAIAKAHPQTLAGRQGKAVARGAPAIGPAADLVAAVAIPAFMGYLRREREMREQMDMEQMKGQQQTAK